MVEKVKKKAMPSGNDDGPQSKLILIGDEEYDKKFVVSEMCEVISEMEQDKADEVFGQAQSEGSAVAGAYPTEHAEHYMQQLRRADPMIYCDIQEEKQ